MNIYLTFFLFDHSQNPLDCRQCTHRWLNILDYNLLVLRKLLGFLWVAGRSLSLRMLTAEAFSQLWCRFTLAGWYFILSRRNTSLHFKIISNFRKELNLNTNFSSRTFWNFYYIAAVWTSWIWKWRFWFLSDRARIWFALRQNAKI
jgi:hypothetical protein